MAYLGVLAHPFVAYFAGTGMGQTTAVTETQRFCKSEGIDFVHYDGIANSFSGHAIKSLGGLTAHGTGDIADEFIADLNAKINDYDGIVKINLIGDSRGAISALKVVKRIQKDPKLANRVEIVLDLKDPVPGNSSLGIMLGTADTASEKVCDLSDCTIVKSAHVTLATKKNSGTKQILNSFFKAIIPRFHPETKMELDVLPIAHNGQEHSKDIRYAYNLGLAKSKQLILEHKGTFSQEVMEDLKATQRTSYSFLNEPPHLKKVSSGKPIHYGGKVVLAKAPKYYLNTRHPMLAYTGPDTDKPSVSDVMLAVDPPVNLSHVEQLRLMPRGLLCIDKINTKIESDSHFNSVKLKVQNANNRRSLGAIRDEYFNALKSHFYELQDAYAGVVLNALKKDQSLAEIPEIPTAINKQVEAFDTLISSPITLGTVNTFKKSAKPKYPWFKSAMKIVAAAMAVFVVGVVVASTFGVAVPVMGAIAAGIALTSAKGIAIHAGAAVVGAVATRSAYQTARSGFSKSRVRKSFENVVNADLS